MKQITSGIPLPDDIIMEILLRLSIKTLLRVKSVSRSLLNLITSSKFVKLHLCRSLIRNSSTILIHSGESFLMSYDFDRPQCPVVQLDTHPDVIKYHSYYVYPPTVIGICNGVVCYRHNNEDYILYNPATRAYKQVPRRQVSSRAIYHEEFAYDCISDDFKIYSFLYYYEQRRQADVETYLFSLKDNSWSKIKNPPRIDGGSIFGSCIANNSLYWKFYDHVSNNIQVLRFNLSSHMYEEISLPIRDIHKISFGVLKDRLHMIEFGFGLNIWMLQDDNCWTRVFHCSDWEYKQFLSAHSLSGFPPFWPMLYTYSKDGLKIIAGCLERYTKVICCDLESQTISVVQVLGLPGGGCYTATLWAESVVPLG